VLGSWKDSIPVAPTFISLVISLYFPNEYFHFGVYLHRYIFRFRTYCHYHGPVSSSFGQSSMFFTVNFLCLTARSIAMKPKTMALKVRTQGFFYIIPPILTYLNHLSHLPDLLHHFISQPGAKGMSQNHEALALEGTSAWTKFRSTSSRVQWTTWSDVNPMAMPCYALFYLFYPVFININMELWKLW
jgi:hypothetical protein